MIIEYGIVFVLTLLIGGFSIPIGVLMSLDPIGVYVAATAGSLIYMLVVLFGGGQLRERLFGSKSDRDSGSDSRARKLLDRWGVPGLAFVGGLLLGPTITLLAALTLDVDRRRFGWWYAGSTVIGFALFTWFWDAVL